MSGAGAIDRLRLRAGRLAWGAALAALVAAGAPAPQAAAAGSSAAVDEIVELELRFPVRNVNRSKLPCVSDGASYEVAGHLVAPRSVLEASSPAVTLYLHGLGYGDFFWRFRDVPGYDYALEQARSGHASVTIDRLGYDRSSRPAGSQICLGSQADVAHQVVTALRAGGYAAGAGEGPAFARVALAGHSIGAQIAQIATYSFGDVDALISAAYASEGATPLAAQASFRAGTVCAAGGDPALAPAAPGGYAYFGETPEDFRTAMFHDADPSVVDAATALRNPDPCGDHWSVLPAIFGNRPGLRSVDVPVLIACAAEDAVFSVGECSQQEDLYPSSPDVSTEIVRGAGHGITLERESGRFRALVSDWLRARGF